MDKKIKILMQPSDYQGVGYWRTIWPAQSMEKHHNDEFDIEIGVDVNFEDINYLSKFDIIHFHRQMGDYAKFPELAAKLSQKGILIIMDIDDYWEPATTHPLYEIVKKEKLSEKILSNLKYVDYVTTTTDIFKKYILKHNPNVHVIPNAVDMTQKMWLSESQENKSEKCRISWIGGSCYDKKTEILTENGFKFFEDLGENEKVACLNPENNHLEFHKPIKFIKEKFEGNLQCGRNNLIDYAVTPNHKMYVSPSANISVKKLNFSLIESQKIFKENMHFKKDAIWEGEKVEYMIIPALKEKYENNAKYNVDKKIDMNLWLKFFGFWIAEGWTTKSENLKQVGICQVKSNEYLQELFNDLKTMGYNPTYTKDGNQVRVFDIQLWEYLIQFGNSFEKFVPKEILNLCPEQLNIFLDWYLKGDGSQENGGIRFDKRYNKTVQYKTNRKRAYTASKKLADNIQEICLKTGVLSTVSNRGKKNSIMKDGRTVNAKFDALVISVGSSGIRSPKNPLLKSENQYEEYYNDYVYCVNVPHNIIYVRRNGKTMWCGNSHLHDLLLLNDSMSKLNHSQELKDKYQIVMCGYDIRGSITEIRPDGSTNIRQIQPQESVWNRFEEIFTSNYSLIENKEYIEYLKRIKKDDFPGYELENYIRRWTLPLTQYGKHYDYCDVCLAPLEDTEMVKNEKGTIFRRTHIFNEVKSELKIIEAGMKKKALIAQNFGIYKELLKDGETGILVSDNKKGWYKAIRELILNPELREKLANNLHEFVKEKYELKNVTKERVEFYKKTLQDKKEGKLKPISIMRAIPVPGTPSPFSEKCN